LQSGRGMAKASECCVAGCASVLLVTLLTIACGKTQSALPEGGQEGELIYDGAASGSAPDGSGSAVDTDPDCTLPVAGAACTSDQVPCATCCTDRWTCQDGVWQRGFIGCLPVDFACGKQTCSEVGSYCEIATDSNGQAQYACKTLPSACATARCPACSCLSQAGISFSKCTTNSGGDIWVVK